MGRKGKYTARQVIAAIPGTGGNISEIARRLGCEWHTAAAYIEKYSTVKQSYDAESNKVKYYARSNIIEAILDGDLQTSKWWVGFKDDEFKPPAQRIEHTGADGGEIELKTNVIVVREVVETD